MNIRKNVVRCGALLAAALAMMPAVLAAETETVYIPKTVPAASLTPAAQTAEEDWKLLLVNPWHTLPEEYEMELATLSNGLQVDKRIYDDLEDMLSACREAGLSPIVCSAYRTEATQARLYRNKVARVRASGVPEDQVEAEAARWVAKPGTSEHQTGLALDIVAASYQILDEKQEDTAEQQWLMENSWKYGFVLRYPSEKMIFNLQKDPRNGLRGSFFNVRVPLGSPGGTAPGHRGCGSGHSSPGWRPAPPPLPGQSSGSCESAGRPKPPPLPGWSAAAPR